jgi:hypothetical protein
MRARGVSSTVAIVAVVVIVLIAVSGFFLLTQGAPKTSPSSGGTASQTAKSGPAPPINVTQAYLTHLDNFANFSMCSYSATCVYSYTVLNDYGNSTRIVWLGQSFGGPRNATGSLAIQQLYQGLTGIIQSMNISLISVKASGDQVNVMMNVSGASEVLGPYHGTINAQATYAYVNGSWVIVNETWNYLALTAPNANNPNPPPVGGGGY